MLPNINETQHKQRSALKHITVMLNAIMLSVIMLSVIMLSVIMLSVIMLNVVMLNVVVRGTWHGINVIVSV